MTSARRDTAALVTAMAALSGLIWIAYAPSLRYDFINFDDPYYVTNNAQVRNGITFDGVVWAFTTAHAANWHPLTWLSHMLDVELFGTDAGAHRAVNVLLHTVNALVLLLVLRGLTGSTIRSGIVAGLFALHPLRVESVVWIAERKDVLSTLFLLVCMGAYASWTRHGGRARYAVVVAAYAAGLMSKPIVITAPLLLLCLDYWPLKLRIADCRLPIGDRSGGRQWFSRVVEKWPLFALAVVAGAMTVTVQSVGALRTLGEVPLWARLANAVVAYAAYLGKTFWPMNLALLYPHPATGIALWKVGLCGTILVGISAWVWREREASPYLIIGWLWYLLSLAPVIGIVQAGDQGLADRYTYVPMIGAVMGVVWYAGDFRLRIADCGLRIGGVRRSVWRQVGAVGLVGAVLVVMVWRTTAQVRMWESSATLFEHSVSVTGDNAPARLYLGMAYHSWGQLGEAETNYLEAIRLDPELSVAHFNLGAVYLDTGRLDAAERHFRDAVRLMPGQVQPLLLLARTLDRAGKREEAIRAYRGALGLAPGSTEAASALAELENPPE